jgi:hypothetical protein
MARAALAHGPVDYMLSIDQIGAFLGSASV